jgi:hypothetical protein
VDLGRPRIRVVQQVEFRHHQKGLSWYFCFTKVENRQAIGRLHLVTLGDLFYLLFLLAYINNTREFHCDIPEIIYSVL